MDIIMSTNLEYDEAADAASDDIEPVAVTEPAVEATPEPEPVAEETKEPEPQVNLGALHQARAKEREANADAEALRAELATLRERTDRMLQSSNVKRLMHSRH